MTEQPQITLEEALKLVDFEFVDGAWRVKRVAGGFIDMRNLMTEQPQITLREALELVIFHRNDDGTWCIDHVWGNVYGDVFGNVHGNVEGNVEGDVFGSVGGTISGRKWQIIETPREKLRRLIEEGAHKSQLLEAIYQLENNND
jgi:hypothetical protein